MTQSSPTRSSEDEASSEENARRFPSVESGELGMAAGPGYVGACAAVRRRKTNARRVSASVRVMPVKTSLRKSRPGRGGRLAPRKISCTARNLPLEAPYGKTAHRPCPYPCPCTCPCPPILKRGGALTASATGVNLRRL